jgi:hypothetical protein
MPYQLNVDEDVGIVEIHISGEFLLPEHAEARRCGLDACRKTGIRRMLADLSGMYMGQNPSDFHLYAFGSSWQGESIPPGMSFAVVLPVEIMSAQRTAFATEVSSKHVLSIEAFGSREEAKTWLLQSHPGLANPADASGPTDAA